MNTTVPRPSWTARLPYVATIAGSLAIAGALLAVSFGHIRTFALLAGAAEWEAVVIAATVDALVVLAVAAIGHAKRTGHTPPPVAKVALVVGIVATTGANLHYGLSHGWMGIVVSLWVPVAAELAYQLAMAAVRIGADAPAPATPSVATEEDGRPVICTRVIGVATVAATMPPRPVATPEPADVRPDICGQFVATEDVAMPERPVICGGHLIPAAEVAMPPVDTRRPVCSRPVTVAELLALSPVAMPRPAATEETPVPTTRPRLAKRAVATPAATVADREAAVLDWLTAPSAPADRLATAAGPDIVAVLAEAGHGRVSARTGRRILADVRAALDESVAA